MIGSIGSTRRTRTALVVAGMVTGLVIAACGGSSDGASNGTIDAAGASGSAAAAAKSLTVGADATQFGHFMPGQTRSNNVDFALWTPLTIQELRDGKIEIVNAVAKEFSTEDSVDWTITLNEGWTFQNGEPVTAQSFADSWNYSAYGPNVQGENFSFALFEGYEAMNPTEGDPTAKELSGVEVVNDHELKVTLTKPLSILPTYLSASIFAPLPKVALDDPEAFDKLPIGNGPYQLDKPGLTPGATSLKLTRFADYAGPNPGHVEQYTVNLYQDLSTGYTDFRSGSVDVVPVSGNDLTAATGEYKNQITLVDMPSVLYLGFPLWDERFADPLVRQAFSLAIDRKTIAEKLLQGLATPATSLSSPTIPGGGEPTCDYCTFDPEKAKELLAEAGGWKSGKLELWTSTYEAQTGREVLGAIANQLRTNLGIDEVAENVQDVNQIYTNLAEHTVSGPYLFMGGAADAYTISELMLTPGGAWNVNGFENKEVTDLLAQAAAADGDTVWSTVQDANRVALEGVPLSPIVWPRQGIVFKEGLTGVLPSLYGGADLSSIR